MIDQSQSRIPGDRGENSVTGDRKSLNKTDKLRLKSDFDQVRNTGSEAIGKLLLAVLAPSPDGALRCGVICGKKYNKLAVDRNRARRLLWESYRLLKPHIGICHLILIPRRRMMNSKRQAVTAELAGLLKKAGLLAAEYAVCPPES